MLTIILILMTAMLVTAFPAACDVIPLWVPLTIAVTNLVLMTITYPLQAVVAFGLLVIVARYRANNAY